VSGAKRERLIREVMSFRFVSPVLQGRFFDAVLAALMRLLGAARWLARGARG
jgi:hypothetical protein